MKSWLIGIGALATLTAAPWALAADHRDAPATTADPSIDINDVYAFTSGNNIIVAMTVFPVADMTSMFSDTAQYVFNLDTGTAFGETIDSKKIICSFDAAQMASCYFGN